MNLIFTIIVDTSAVLFQILQVWWFLWKRKSQKAISNADNYV